MEHHLTGSSPVETEEEEYLDPALTTQTTRDILWALRIYQKVKLPSSWIKFINLPSDEYKKLRRLLNQDKENYAHEKIRLNYNSYRSQLTLKMSGMVHDIFTREISSAISNWVESINATSVEPVASMFERVTFKGCSAIEKLRLAPSMEIQDAESLALAKHSPDAAFWIGGSPFPTLVIESVYSHNVEAMAWLARDYILGSRGHIKVVLGFYLAEEEKDLCATVSVWRAIMHRTTSGTNRLECRQTLIEKVFRRPDGFAIPGTLYLDVKDFLPRNADTSSVQYVRFEIHYATLSRLLTDAETEAAEALAVDQDEDYEMESIA